MSRIKRRVIHAPLEIAGQVGLICESLRRRGFEATGYNYYDTYLNYEKVIQTDAFELAKILEPAIEFYDLFHFHNGYTFIDDLRDIDMIDAAGKPMIMHHRGNDVRSFERARKGKGYENPYVNTDSSLPDEEIERRLQLFSTKMSAAIVQDYELYHYVADYYHARRKKVYVLPRLINTKQIQPHYPTVSRTPLIVHAPTNPEFKGSVYIEKALDHLRRKYAFHYKRIENMSHREALTYYKQADLIIDQILCGAYGNLSVEGMALGKPVVCYIRPDLVSTFPKDLPIISANPDNIEQVLADLLKQPETWPEKGWRGRQYVEKHHEAERVIQKLINIYQQVLAEA